MTRNGRNAPRAVLAVAVALATTIAGCASSPNRAHGKVSVVASFYPAGFLAQRIGGARVAVGTLTPSGAEPHDLELTTTQIDAIQDADLVVFLGGGFQPAVERAVKGRDGASVDLLGLVPGEERRRGDSHVWLDPVLVRALAGGVERALVRADPKHRTTYTRGARALDQQLAGLDDRYRSGLSPCARREIVTAHEAFGYLARRYGLRQDGVAGISPDAEPSPQRIADLADLVRTKGITTVFTEKLVSPRVADTLAREAGGVRTETLDPLEGLTARQLARGDDYVTVMDANLAKLRAALRCA